MNVDPLHEGEGAAPRIAAAIGDAGRARMLYSLVGNVARTSTELALIARVSPSTASAHLRRLRADGLVTVEVQGKQRCYSLRNADIARVLEALSVAAGGDTTRAASPAPDELRAARTCYDHMAGVLGVALYDRLRTLRWIAESSSGGDAACELTPQGVAGCESLGIDVDATRALRRRFAYGCLDWSERRPHLGGALGAAVLRLALKQRWVIQDRGRRTLTVTSLGRRLLASRLGIRL
jgi:DNA-binding transcriptional ArsR family regulator